MTKKKKRQRLFDRYKLKNKLKYSFSKFHRTRPDLDQFSTRESREDSDLYKKCFKLNQL